MQAAIAALHAEAATAADTDWPQIAALYGVLTRVAPSPVVALNRAVAVAEACGPEAAMAIVDELGRAGVLDEQHLFHATRGELLRRLGRTDEAREAFERAGPSPAPPPSGRCWPAGSTPFLRSRPDDRIDDIRP